MTFPSSLEGRAQGTCQKHRLRSQTMFSSQLCHCLAVWPWINRKLRTFSGAQVHPLSLFENGVDSKVTYLIKLLWGLNKLIYIKYIERHLTCSKYSLCFSYYYCCHCHCHFLFYNGARCLSCTLLLYWFLPSSSTYHTALYAYNLSWLVSPWDRDLFFHGSQMISIMPATEQMFRKKYFKPAVSLSLPNIHMCLLHRQQLGLLCSCFSHATPAVTFRSSSLLDLLR